MSLYDSISTRLSINKDMIMSPNLCDRFKQDELDAIGNAVWNGYDRDRRSRSKWERRMNAAMDLAMQVQVAKTFPWPGCSNVIFPLVTIAALQFSARAYANLVPGNNVVRYRVINDDQKGSIKDRALRIGRHMSWQVTEQDEAWEEEHDRLLINLSIVGTAYDKSYFDPGLGYPVDELVTARDLVMDYWAKSVERAARVTQHVPLYRNEIYERCARKIFSDVRDEVWFKQAPLQDYDAQYIQTDNRQGVNPTTSSDEDAAYRTLEQHRWLDLDKDGYQEPYIVTIEASSKKTLRIVSRFEETGVEHTASGNKILRINPELFYTKYSFIPNPEGANLDLGFGVFLGPINETVNSCINQLIDFGTLQNSNGGLLGRGAKIRGGVYTWAPWEWKRVDSTGDDLRKSIYQFPERKGSEVLFSLLQLLVQYANRVAGTTDTVQGENPGQNTPAQTYQGMTEQGMQIFGMAFKRVWRSMKQEFKKRYELNKRFSESVQKFGSGEDFIRREDYSGNPDLVAPVANPRVTSSVMKIQQSMAVKEDSRVTPGYDIEQVTREFLSSLEIDGIDRIYPGPKKTPPLPNWRLQVEQQKAQVALAKIKASQMTEAMKLLEQRRLNVAKIAQLEAQAMKLIKEAQVVDIKVQMEAMSSAIEAHKSYGDMLNQRIEMLIRGNENEGSDESDAGGAGVSKLAPEQGNQGIPQGNGQSPPQSNGAVGGGQFPG